MAHVQILYYTDTEMLEVKTGETHMMIQEVNYRNQQSNA